jgi:hypothetical protein
MKRDRRDHKDYQKSIRQLNRPLFDIPLKGCKRNGSQPYDGGRGDPCSDSYSLPGGLRSGTAGRFHNCPNAYPAKMGFL